MEKTENRTATMLFTNAAVCYNRVPLSGTTMARIRLIRAWKPDDDRLLAELIANKHSPLRVSIKMRRTESAVRTRADKLDLVWSHGAARPKQRYKKRVATAAGATGSGAQNL
jgi:hypothetical protein